MAVKLSPVFQDAQLDSSGNPYVGAQLFTYAAGSTTKQTTYQDSSGGSQHQNPIILNARGEPPAPIWLTAGQTYKFVLATPTDSDPPVGAVRTVDNVSGVNDTTTTIDQWVSGPSPTYVSATSFTLTGDQTTTFHVGRRLKTTNTAGTIYSTIVASAFGALTTITVMNDSGSLDSGLSAVSYGIISANNDSLPDIGDEYVCEGRLTLTSGTPVTTSDVTAAETVYFAPFRGNRIDLYDGTKWVRYKFSELSLDVPDATQVNDVFVYNNAGTLTLEAVAWSSDTSRATALTTQDGVLVKTGSTGRRYLGSFYATTAGNGQTEDSKAKRYLWNYYNRFDRFMLVTDATDTWNYTTATLRQANASAANQLDMVRGVDEDAVEATVVATARNSAAGTTFTSAIGLDSTNTMASGCLANQGIAPVNDYPGIAMAKYIGMPGIGRHVLTWLEQSQAVGTTTWIGDNGSPTIIQSGIHGMVRG